VPAVRLSRPGVPAWRGARRRLAPRAARAERLAAFLGGEPEIAWAS
jgi:hypothetical protein